MTIYFMGGEMASFVPSDSTVKEGTTLSGIYNISFARCYISITGATAYVETPSIGTLTSAWLHFDIAVSAGSGNATWTDRLIWYDNSSVARVKLQHQYSTDSYRVAYDVGAGFVVAGAAFTVDTTALQSIDLNVVCNTASGSINLYCSGTERITSGTINLSAITALNKVRVYGAETSVTNKTYISQMIVADEPTIGWRLLTRYPNGAGSSGDWTGDYTGVDELIYSDADFINSATADQVELFTQTGPAVTGYIPRAVGVYARARRGASGPQNVKLALRASSTNYFSADKALGLGYTAVGHIWETNPATTADWLASSIDALQPGGKSAT